MMAGNSDASGQRAVTVPARILRAVTSAAGLLAIGIVVVLVCLAGTYLLVTSQREERLDMAVRNMRRGSTMLADATDARIRLVDQWLQRLLEKPDSATDAAAPLLRDRLVAEWGVSDAAGRPLAGTARPALLADRPWPVGTDGRSGARVLADADMLFVARVGDNGGAAWASVPLDDLAALFDARNMPEGVFMGLRTAERRDLLQSPARPIPASAMFSARTLLDGQLEAFMALDIEATLAHWRMRALGLGAVAGSFAVALVVLMSLGTRQVRRQEALARSLGEATRRLESAQTLAGIGTVTLDVASYRTVWSDNVCAWRGFRPGTEFTLAETFALIHPDDRGYYLAKRAASVAGRRPWSVVVRVRHAAGYYLFEEYMVLPTFDPEGQLVSTLALVRDITATRETEAGLRAAMDKLETVIAAGPGVLWHVLILPGDHVRMLYVSPNVETLTGVSWEETMGDSPEQQARERRLLVRRRAGLAASPTPGQGSIEVEDDHPTRGRLRIRSYTRLLPRADGLEEMVGYAVDITAQHTAETALAAAQARLSALVEDAPTVLFQSEVLPDMSGRRLYVSPNVERLTGHSVAWTIEGHNWASAKDPPVREAWQEVVAAAVATGQASVEYRLRHLDGHWIWLRSIIRPKPREGGGWLITGTLMDITRERELAAALDNARAELQAMVDAGPGALYRAEVGADLSWRSLFVATAIERITGYSPAEVQAALWGGPGVPPSGLEPGGQALLRDAARRALGRESLSFDLRLAMPGGGWVWLRNTVRPDPAAHDAAGDAAVSVVGYLTDVSFEKEQATRLAHAARVATLGEMTGGVAHDFNNMLAAITNCHALVLRRSDDPLVREAMAIAASAAARGADLVRQMLAFTRHRDSDAQAVDIAAVLSDLHGLLRHACGEAVALAIEVPAGLWPVAAERGALEMVIVNLATNARDAMPGGGRFCLSARNHDPGEPLPSGLPLGEYVVLAARDTGHGMAPEILARSTERFFTTKLAGEGTGLGLAMAEGFVRHWGGAMQIASAEGEGTEVRLLLPSARALV